MKNRIFVPFLLLLLSFGLLSAQGVQFEDLSFKEAVKKAKKEGKYVLVDAYTDWCYWCKVLDKKTFPDAELGEMVNHTFVSIKVDMESEAGVPLAWKYRVMSFPNTLVFNGEGQIMYKFGGFRPPAEYSAELQKGLREETQMKYPGEPMDFETGFPDFYKTSFKVKGQERTKAEPEEISAWLNEQEDLFSEAAWSVLWRFSPPEEYVDRFIENKDRFEYLYGSEEVEGVVYNLCYAKVNKGAQDGNEGELEDALDLADRLFGKEDMRPQIGMQMYFFEKTEDWDRYASSLEEYIKWDKYERLGGVNGGCWNLYLKIPENTKWMKKASAWMAEVVKREPSYAYMDTWAAVLWKSGDREQAMAVAQKAINTGKAADEDVAETEKMLKAIQNGE